MPLNQIGKIAAVEYSESVDYLSGLACVIVYESNGRVLVKRVIKYLAHQQLAAVSRAVNQYGPRIRSKAMLGVYDQSSEQPEGEAASSDEQKQQQRVQYEDGARRPDCSIHRKYHKRFPQ